jgi:O-6-methylguanine DNA methyltransferase
MNASRRRSISRIVESAMGPLWLCATEEGLCALAFDGLDDALSRTLVRYDVAPPLGGTHPTLEAAAEQLAAYFAGERRAFDLPLDLLGTPFQRAVWSTLLRIPYGDTWSYGQVAAAVGRPRAARAVGQATGANPLAIVVPCHRVVGHDGSLTGYGSGLHRKQTLLELEQRSSQLPLQELS